MGHPVVSSALQTFVGQPCWLFIKKAEDNKHLRNTPLSMESRKLKSVITDAHDVHYDEYRLLGCDTV